MSGTRKCRAISVCLTLYRRSACCEETGYGRWRWQARLAFRGWLLLLLLMPGCRRRLAPAGCFPPLHSPTTPTLAPTTSPALPNTRRSTSTTPISSPLAGNTKFHSYTLRPPEGHFRFGLPTPSEGQLQHRDNYISAIKSMTDC